MQNGEKQHNQGGLIGAFFRAANPAMEKLNWLVTTYPSKSAAVSGAAADSLFLYQSVLSGNWVGVGGALILGLHADWHLFRYGDPKIKPGEEESFVDPQDHRFELNPLDIVANRKVYPWEYAAFMRMAFMTTMLAGGLGVARDTGMSVGEISYASTALLGYLVKIGIPQRAPGSVVVPEESKGLGRAFRQLGKYVNENPNATAGKLWIGGLVPYALEGIIKGEPAKVASAALYFLPDFFTMISSKRAKAMDSQGPAP